MRDVKESLDGAVLLLTRIPSSAVSVPNSDELSYRAEQVDESDEEGETVNLMYHSTTSAS